MTHSTLLLKLQTEPAILSNFLQTLTTRTLTAHHSVLIIDVLESVSAPQMPEDFVPGPEDHKLVHDLTEIWDKLSQRSLLEDWHDAEDIPARQDAVHQIFFLVNQCRNHFRCVNITTAHFQKV